MTVTTETAPRTDAPGTPPAERRPRDHSSLYRRVIRRETHSPRATLAITISLVLIIALAWIAVESVLFAIGQQPLLVAPLDAWAATLDLPNAVQQPWIVVGGIVVAVLGLLIVLTAITPGRRARHVAPTTRTAALVDNRVLASSLARTVSQSAGIDPDQVVVTVGHRTVVVTVQPSSGFSIDKKELEETVSEHIRSFDLTPPLRSSVVLSQRGAVGR